MSTKPGADHFKEVINSFRNHDAKQRPKAERLLTWLYTVSNPEAASSSSSVSTVGLQTTEHTD